MKNESTEIRTKEKDLLNALCGNTEKAMIDALNKLIKDYDDFFEELKHYKITMVANGDTKVGISLLWFAISKNYKKLLIMLLEHGLPVDEGTTCKDDVLFDKQSPLMRACEEDNIDIVNLLLRKKANLLHVSTVGVNVLMKVKSVPVCARIVEVAIKKGQFIQLVDLKDQDGYTALDYSKSRGRIDIVNMISGGMFWHAMKSGSPEKYKDFSSEQLAAIPVMDMLNTARVGYFAFPDKKQIYDALCSKLREITQSNKVLHYPNDCGNITPKKASTMLFGCDVYKKQIQSKQDAVKRVITDYFALLSSPKQCKLYTQFLSQEFERYFKEKHGNDFPKLNADSYEFKTLNGLYYPIPKDGYTGIKQKHALQEFLIALFRKYGLAKKAFKWIGFVPNEDANKMTIKDFLIEDRLGTGLFHNKISHMIQLALLIYSIENNHIKLHYQLNKKPKKLTLQDIANGLVTFKTAVSDKVMPWAIVRDKRDIDHITFCDPYCLGSIIMHQGSSLGITALSDALIDTFCKGINKLLTVYRQHKAFASMTMNEFVVKLDDLDFSIFSNNKYLTRLSIFGAEKKGEEVLKSSDEFAIVRKTYEVKSDFTPRPFTY